MGTEFARHDQRVKPVCGPSPLFIYAISAHRAVHALSFREPSGSIFHINQYDRAINPCDKGEKLKSSAAIEAAKHVLLSGGLILSVGTVTGFLARKINVPDIALFLIVGMLIGPAMLGLINVKSDSALISDHSSFRGQLYSFRWWRIAALRGFEKSLDYDCRLRHCWRVDYRSCDRLGCAYFSRRSLDRCAFAWSDDRLNRSGDAGPHLPADQYSRPRRANRHERVGVQ